MAIAIAVVGLPLITVTAPAQAAQPQPNHSGLVPDVPRKDTPRISNGEIWDIEVVGNRVFIAGSFTSLANTTGNNRGTVSQRYLAAYNINTGLIDTTFRPTFNGGVNAVEASPDGTKTVRRGHLQHDQWGGSPEGRKSEPHNGRAGIRIRHDPQHEQCRYRTRGHELDALRRRKVQPDQRRTHDRPCRTQREHRRRRHRVSTTSSRAVSASTER